MKHLRSGALRASMVLGVLAGSFLPVASAAAADGRCAAGAGVTVVVDYGALGGGTDLGCDPDGGGRFADEVVPAAGFSLSYVASQAGFVCRINGAPATDTCQRTPPQNAYWALFWSDGSRGWTYASSGVGSLKVPDGGSLGWRFQDGGARDYPAAAPTTSPSSTPDPTPTQKPEPTAPAEPAPSSPGASGPSTGGRSPSGPSPSATTSAGDQDDTGASGKPRSEEPDKTQPPGDAAGKPGKAPKGGKNSKAGAQDKGAKAGTNGSEHSSADPALRTTEPLNRTAGDPDPTSGGSALVFLAGGAMVAMAGAAGVIAWRRRS